MYRNKSLGEVATYINGRAFKPSEWESSGTPIVRIQNLNDKNAPYNYSTAVYDKKFLIQKGDLLFAWSASLGAFLWDGDDAWLNQHIFKVVPAEDINKHYLYFYLQAVVTDLYAKTHGSGMVHITKAPFMATKIPVPAISEQERIVARIEELFSQLDASVSGLKTVKEQLKVYRQAVLKEAFEGRYTRTWRHTHPQQSPQSDFDSIKHLRPVFIDTSSDENAIPLFKPKSWIQVRFGEIFEVEVGATPSRRVPEYWRGNIPWVSSGEIHFDAISKTKECITQDGLEHSSTNVQPIGTVMLAMIGEGKTRGQAALLNIEAAHNQNTAAILVSKTPCDPKYIYYFLVLNYENTRHVGSGNNQKALNKERVRALRFPFASFAEQFLIVQEVESRLSVCDSIEKTVDTTLQQAEALRQSILKKAFEGRF